MNRVLLILALGLALRSSVWASTDDIAKPASTDADQLQTGAESGQKEATPDDVDDSTSVVTPVTHFAEKDLHQQALDELIKANNLLAQGQNEAASDAALQAYDDLMALKLKRRGHDRAALQNDRHQAATTYIQAAIAYIQDFAKRTGSTPEAQDEVRSRLEDLRDVAREYPELNKKLDQALLDIPAAKT